jgi:hypothetical protein
MNESDVLVAPGMSVNVVPPSVDLCHCTEGAGLPEAAAVNDTDPPATTIALTGCVVTWGTVCTVNRTGAVSADPAGLVNAAR